jgi:hypothetical protein
MAKRKSTYRGCNPLPKEEEKIDYILCDVNDVISKERMEYVGPQIRPWNPASTGAYLPSTTVCWLKRRGFVVA